MRSVHASRSHRGPAVASSSLKWAAILGYLCCALRIAQAEDILVQIDKSPVATQSTPIILCTQPSDVSLTATVANPPSNTTECQVNAPTYRWSGSNNLSGIGPTTQMTVHPSDVSPLSASVNVTWARSPIPPWSPEMCNSNATGSATASIYLKVPAIVQFNPSTDPNVFPKCVNAAISQSDFVIITDPESYKDQVTVTYSPDPTATAGNHTAIATLCGSPKTCNYQVVGSGTWVPVSNIPLPAPSGTASGSKSQDNTSSGWFIDDIYHTVVTYTGPYAWTTQPILTMTGDASTQTEVANTTAWTIDGSVTGEGSLSLPFVANGKITVTIGGSWETSTTKTCTGGPQTGANATIFAWRYKFYQKVVGFTRTVSTWKTTVKHRAAAPTFPGPDWSVYSWSSSGTTILPNVGGTEYAYSIERKCP